jgi:hypothetical protein
MSFSTIDAFLKSTTNMEADLSTFRKAPIVAAFLDHVLQVNAANWQADSDFLDLLALKALWEAWWCARKGAWKAEPAASQSGQNQQTPASQTNGGSGYGGHPYASYQQQGGFSSQPRLYAPGPNEKNLCRRYNEGNCPNHHAGCSITTKQGLMKLYHLCNFMKRDNNQQKLCLEKHVRVENHPA